MEVQPPSDILYLMIKNEIITGNEFYHVYNRGVDKREIFDDQYDIDRFYQSMVEFNSVEPIGSIFENSFRKESPKQARLQTKERLVEFIAYCLNPNHYHFILEQLVDNGISIFMQRLGGYTMYFNEKNKRSGSLFQGRYKAKHIASNDYLLHLSAYVSLNNEVHQLGGSTSKFDIKSSWNEYIDPKNNENFCKKNIILDQFKSAGEYKIFVKEALSLIQEKKRDDKDLTSLIFD